MTQTQTIDSRLNDEILQACREVPLHLLLGIRFPNRKFKIKCPFHAERTPSCVLFPTGGYKCFGCSAHGNSIDFITKTGATFEEAVNELIKYI